MKIRQSSWIKLCFFDFAGRGTYISPCVHDLDFLRPLCFHQIIEDSNSFSSENRYFDYNLSGRCPLNSKDSRRCSDVLCYSETPIARAGGCDKSKEVRDDPLTGDGVSGYDNKLQRNDYLSFTRETPKTEIVMFKFVSEPTSFNFTIDESVKTSYINNPGCPSNTTKQSYPLTTAYSSLDRKEVLSEKYVF